MPHKIILGMLVREVPQATLDAMFDAGLIRTPIIAAKEPDMNNQEVEAEIQAKGLTAPRITEADINACIRGVDYHVFPGSQLTVCCLTLRNGFTVTGESACASPENFDAELGRKIAYGNAHSKVWALEAYLLKQRLWIAGHVTEKSASIDGVEGLPDTIETAADRAYHETKAFGTLGSADGFEKPEPLTPPATTEEYTKAHGHMPNDED